MSRGAKTRGIVGIRDQRNSMDGQSISIVLTVVVVFVVIFFG